MIVVDANLRFRTFGGFGLLFLHKFIFLTSMSRLKTLINTKITKCIYIYTYMIEVDANLRF